MAHVSGQHGRLYLDGKGDNKLEEVAKVRDWSLNMQHQPLDTTTLGDKDRMNMHGLRSYSGSGTLLYYQENDSNLKRITGDTFKTAHGDPSDKPFGRRADAPDAPVKLELKLFSDPARNMVLFAYITSVNITCATGEVIQAAFTFEGTGAPTTINL